MSSCIISFDLILFDLYTSANMNYVDFVRHALYMPNYFHRRYDFDLYPIPKIYPAQSKFKFQTARGIEETAKRIALSLLPFIGLYRPAGVALSISMNMTRTFAHLQRAVVAEGERLWSRCAIEIGKAFLAGLALSMTVFHLTSALFMTTGWDALQAALLAGEAAWSGEYCKAFEETLQTLVSTAYLSFMIMGALEAMVAFALFQGVVSLYQAAGEWRQGRYLEGFAKLGMAAVRLTQANRSIQQIRKRNAYMEIQQIRAILLKMIKGREASHLIDHPLSSLEEQIALKQAILIDGKGNEIAFGAHFHGNGGALVKGENLIFRTKVIDGEEMTELDFKINHAFRGKIDEALQQLKRIQAKEMDDILSISGSHARKITIASDSFLHSTDQKGFENIGIAHKIQMDGLGTVLIGASVDQPTLYDRVVVRLTSNRTLFDLHEMLALLDLDQAISLSRNEDIERLKMGHLFRTFFPREATPFERTDEFFSLSLGQLKAKMVEKSPGMQSIFDKYYSQMREEHLLNGRVRYRISGLADAARKEGARGLTAAVMGAGADSELYERVASMIQMGIISTEMRHANGFDKHGLGESGIDYISGGADSVFTQLFTEKSCREELPLDRFNYYSKVRFLISLDALEMGTYQYHSDNLGNRTYQTGKFSQWFEEPYESRDGILEFIQGEENSSFNGGHEIMLKERLSPSFFKGLIVADEKTKTDLLEYLNKSSLIQEGKILNIPVDQFIRIGTQVSEDLVR